MIIVLICLVLVVIGLELVYGYMDAVKLDKLKEIKQSQEFFEYDLKYDLKDLRDMLNKFQKILRMYEDDLK